MNTGRVLVFPSSTESQVQGGVPSERQAIVSGLGGVLTGEISQPQSTLEPAAAPQDEVKVQWDNPDQTVIYQFVNQHGSLILQVPSEQMLNLSRQISQELAHEAAPGKSLRIEERKDNGH